jgi:hypothetical protein
VSIPRAAGAEGDPHGALLAHVLRRRGHADVAAHGQPHAGEADRERRERPRDEEDRSSDPGGGVVSRQHQQDQRNDDHEDRQGLRLAAQERLRAFLHGERNLLHARGPGISGEYLAHKYECDSERQNGDHTDHCNEALLASCQRQGVAHPCGERRHTSSRSASARSPSRREGHDRMQRRPRSIPGLIWTCEQRPQLLGPQNG